MPARNILLHMLWLDVGCGRHGSDRRRPEAGDLVDAWLHSLARLHAVVAAAVQQKLSRRMGDVIIVLARRQGEV